MRVQPKYSVVLNYCQLDDVSLDYIENLLLKGIVVHLFLSCDFSEELSLNEWNENIFTLAKENNLLFVYDNLSLEEYEEEVIAFDDNILNSKFYDEVCCNKDIEFNNEQYSIVTASLNTNIIVASGAGTGKTTTMINRLMFLRKTDEEFTFDKAALITFTNEASNKMREKLTALLERYYRVTKNTKYIDMISEVAESNISTIHSFARNFLSEQGKNIGINKAIKVRSFRYLRKNAITEALNKIYKENRNLYSIIKNYPIYEVENKFLKIWESLDNFSLEINSKSYTVDFGQTEEGFSELLEKTLKYANEIMDENKEINFEVSDLIKKLSNKNLLKGIEKKYKLIMVDEFQDSDNIQIEFITALCRETNSDLFVVGDEKQSIYRFRGAEHTAFYKIKENLTLSKKQLKEFNMVRNYRTDAKLLKDINDIFIDIDKRVRTFKYKPEDYIYSLVRKNVDNGIEYLALKEDFHMVEFYSKLLEEKKEDEKVTVLMRTNDEVEEFKEFCDRNKILCRVDVAGGFYRHEAVRDFYVMLQALICENDNKINYSFINTPYIKEEVDKKKVISSFESDELKQYLSSILALSGWGKYSEEVIRTNPLVLIDKIIDGLAPVKNYYEKTLIESMKLQKKYKEIAFLKTLEYKLNLEHLVYLLKKNFSENITSIYDIEEFLKLKIATDNQEDIRRLDEAYENKFIKCITVHKSKGLEFDYVVIHNLTKQFLRKRDVEVIIRSKENVVNVGYRMNLDDNEYKNNHFTELLKDENSEVIGEETRLFYVATTRCKRKLYLNTPKLAANSTINNWQSLISGGEEHV